MKDKAKIFPVVFLLIVFISLISCNQQKTEWQGTIEEVDGVTVVKNPEEPYYGELIFELEEDCFVSVKFGPLMIFLKRKFVDSSPSGRMLILG